MMLHGQQCGNMRFLFKMASAFISLTRSSDTVFVSTGIVESFVVADHAGSLPVVAGAVRSAILSFAIWKRDAIIALAAIHAAAGFMIKCDVVGRHAAWAHWSVTMQAAHPMLPVGHLVSTALVLANASDVVIADLAAVWKRTYGVVDAASC